MKQRICKADTREKSSSKDPGIHALPEVWCLWYVLKTSGIVILEVPKRTQRGVDRKINEGEMEEKCSSSIHKGRRQKQLRM